jgi:hypothetical protein
MLKKEVVKFFDNKVINLTRALGLSSGSYYRWGNEIPLKYQHTIEVLTNKKFIARISTSAKNEKQQ